MTRPATGGISLDLPNPSAGEVLRSLLLNLLLWTWTTLMVVAALPLLLCPPPVMIGHARVWMRGVQWLAAHVIGLSYEVRGREHATGPPAIFAFKHQSAWETLAIYVLLDRATIALKRELTAIPLFGWYLAHAGMITIDRGGGASALRALVNDARAALNRGISIVIFPEGTRMAPGERRPYHPGVAGLYTRLGCRVVPVALNSGVFWGRRSFVKRLGRITVEFLPPIEPGLDRKAFMAELEQRLEGATARLVAEAERQLGAR